MSSEVKCWCRHCGTELPPSHVGECPSCHKTGKRCEVEAHVTVGVRTEALTFLNRAQIEQVLDKAERPLWRKIIDSLRNNVIVDGFEIGFPSGIKVTFRVKHEPYKQFNQEETEVISLGRRIGTKVGCRVEVRQTGSGRWGFYAAWAEGDENFAYARKRKRAKCLRVSTKEEWAVRAGIDKSRYGVSPRGWWGEPVARMDMNQDNAESLEEVADILAKVCKARHR